jgi:hypothetical protein
MQPSTIGGINRLPYKDKRGIYTRLTPPALLERFNLNPSLVDSQGNDLVDMTCPTGSANVEMSIFHQHTFPDPILYGHMTDTLNGQIHVLLYVLNDPRAPRFDVDRMPDGTPTKFGIYQRNLEAEVRAMRAGLAPGQIRQGLGMLAEAIESFEAFVKSLGHDLYFVEPLFYHNAVIFERYGFSYQIGRRRMAWIQQGFSPGGELTPHLDSSTPFRAPEAAASIRMRSWAIHDGILGERLTDITMYKVVGKKGHVRTTPDIPW